MSGDALIALLIGAIALMGSPGPATLSSAGSGAAYGFRGGLRYTLGICTGTSTVVLLVATGVTGLVIALPGARTVLIGAASLYILYLAWKIANAPPISKVTSTEEAPPYLAGLALALANPKAYAAIGAVFSSTVLIEASATRDAITKAAILITLVPFINLTWLAAGASLARLMASPRASRVLNICFAILLVISVAIALLL
jgi:threonine/homoserine/homoserine lactone efflux protein